MSMKTHASLALACAIIAGCNDKVDTGIDDLKLPAEANDASIPDEVDAAVQADDAAVSEVDSDASVAEDAAVEPPKPADLTGLPSFAVHVSAYGQTTGVTLIDGEGGLIKELFVSSQSELPGLSAALASDIGLPTQACDPKYLSILGRFGSNTIWQLDYRDAKNSRQFSSQLSADGDKGAFQSNPQDMLCLGGDRALISRYEPNVLPGAAALDLGDDLVLVDLAKGELTERISLDAFRVPLGSETAYARPGSIVRRGDYAVVGLSLLSASFAGTRPGKLAIVSLADFSTRSLSFDKLANCGTLQPVVDRADAVIVSCAGTPYGDPASAGLALVAIDADGNATVEAEFQATVTVAGATAPSAIYGSPTSIGGSRVIAVAGDQEYTAPDAAYVLDLVDGSYELAFTGDSAGGIGSGAVRFETGLVLVPDSSVGVRVFALDAAGGLTEQDPLALRSDVPARTIRPMRTF